MSKSKRDLLLLLCMGVCLGLIVAWASLSLRFGTRQDTVSNLSAILNGEPLYFGGTAFTKFPHYNRVLFPGVHRLLVQFVPLGSAGQWYLALRIVTFQAAFVAFALVCRFSLFISAKDVRLASLLLALATIVSFNFSWEDPTDALDMLALTLGVGASLARRYVACLALALLFAFNRESAAYLGIIWVLLTMRPTNFVRAGIEGAAISVISYGTTLGIRNFVQPAGSGNWFTPLNNLDIVLRSIAHFTFLNWIATLVAILVLFALNIRGSNPMARRFVSLAVIFSIAALFFGLINEHRVHLPCFLMLAFAIASSGESVQKA